MTTHVCPEPARPDEHGCKLNNGAPAKGPHACWHCHDDPPVGHVCPCCGAGRPSVTYDRKVLVDVLVYHYRADIKGCGCGWSELGRSWPEHVAIVYEESVSARAEARGCAVSGDPSQTSANVDVLPAAPLSDDNAQQQAEQ